MSETILPGTFYDGKGVLGAPATLIVSGRQASLVGQQVFARFERSQLRVSPPSGISTRFVTLPNGGQFQCVHKAILDLLPQEVGTEGTVSWLERRWSVALGCLVAVVALLVCAYLYLLPVAASYAADQISPKTEMALGDEGLGWMDRNRWLTTTEIDPAQRYALLGGFAKLVQGLPQEQYYTLMFRKSRHFGINAFAMPGGGIVLTDDMVDAANSEEEILAVLAHEIGHIERRHATRNILHDSVLAIVATALTADASSMSTAVAGFPVLLTRMMYSREFEEEADDYAFALLKRHGISPSAFADLMERVAEEHGDVDPSMAFLASHPMTNERVARARAAAAASPVNGK